ncbi:hypothetical protein [Bradyrhizobium cenepequi]
MQPSDFGTGQSPDEVTYHTIAAQIRNMVPRALTPNALDAALTMIEYLRDEGLKLHDANEARAKELDEREAKLNKRARDLALAQRAADAVLKRGPRKIANLWR